MAGKQATIIRGFSLSLLALASLHGASITYEVRYFTYPGAMQTYATGVNDAGAIVGYYTLSGDPGGTYHPFVRDANGTYRTLTTPGVSGNAMGINDAGDIVGYYRTADVNTHAFIQRSSGLFETIDLTGGVTYLAAINNSGAAVGATASVVSPSQAFIRMNDGSIEDIDAPFNSFIIELTSINNAGAAGGSIVSPYQDGRVHGYLRNPDGTVKIVDYPLPGNSSIITGINDLGWLVGRYINPSNTGGIVFLRGSDGSFYDTNIPFVPYSGPGQMNNLNQIVGYNDGMAYIATPIPEPGTLAMLGISLGCFLLSRRCRRG